MKLKQRTERKLIKLSEIKLDESNPNKLNEKKTAALSKSLERFGYVDEIVIDKKTRVIADGEHRYKELEKLGIEEVEVKIIDFENDSERRLYRQMKAAQGKIAVMTERKNILWKKIKGIHKEIRATIK